MDRGAAYREWAVDVGSRWSCGVPGVARVQSDGWLLLVPAGDAGMAEGEDDGRVGDAAAANEAVAGEGWVLGNG